MYVPKSSLLSAYRQTRTYTECSKLLNGTHVARIQNYSEGRCLLFKCKLYSITQRTFDILSLSRLPIYKHFRIVTKLCWLGLRCVVFNGLIQSKCIVPEHIHTIFVVLHHRRKHTKNPFHNSEPTVAYKSASTLNVYIIRILCEHRYTFIAVHLRLVLVVYTKEFAAFTHCAFDYYMSSGFNVLACLYHMQSLIYLLYETLRENS